MNICTFVAKSRNFVAKSTTWFSKNEGGTVKGHLEFSENSSVLVCNVFPKIFICLKIKILCKVLSGLSHESLVNYFSPSSILASINSLAWLNSSSQLSSTTCLILIRAPGLRFLILLWCREGHRSQQTRAKQIRRMRRWTDGEVKAHILQFTVPERKKRPKL